MEADFVANLQAGQNDELGPCTVETGYEDQTDGAQVVITDADGSTIGISTLTATGLQVASGSTSMTDTWCGFTFTVDDVPTGSGFYGIATGHRDPVQFTEDEAFSPDLVLTLGDVPAQS